ncbi:MAG: type III pantothenate kinase [Tepidisphaeraceae bacterium]
MDVNLLALNLGNSRLSVGTFVSGELRGVERIEHAQRAEWPALIARAWKPLAGVSAAVAGAEVNPELVSPLEQAVADATGLQIQWIGRDLELPLANLTRRPAQTGVDRLVNVTAAFEQMQKACVVVDAGTAITVDCCSDDGAFVGGAILPGLAMQLAALHERTSSLPLVAAEPPRGAIGDSTEQAILHGVFHGIRGAVKELAERYATELGAWPEIIATGGDAESLFGGWDLIHAIVPDLTLYGIALTYAERHIKSGT